MTLTTEQLRARAESLGLDFFIERRAGIWVKEWFDNGCTSATAEEVMMWSMLANREAVPVADPDYIRRDCGCCGFESLNYFQDSAACPMCNHTPMGKTELYTAPPAPAVPEKCPERVRFLMNMHTDDLFSDADAQEIWNACRAAMLNHVGDATKKGKPQNEPQNIPNNIPGDLADAVNRLLDCDGTRGHFSAIRCSDAREEVERLLAQPVSGGYKLPEGWKLVPVEPTAEMINAALASGALSIRSAYRLMLAAAPEGGNGA